MISAVLHTDPGCPWAYSAIPALRALDWRYGDQLAVAARGHRAHRAREPLRRARLHPAWRGRASRPGSATASACPSPRPRRPAWPAPSRACRLIAAARIDAPGLRVAGAAGAAARELHHDDAAGRGPRPGRGAGRVPGVDGEALVARIDDADVVAAYERDRAEARTAAGSPAELQGKTATDRRARPLHRAVAGARARRRAAGGGRLAAPRGLRRPGRQPRPRHCGASRRPTGRSRCCGASRRGSPPRRPRC